MRIRETFPQPAKANIIMDTTYFGRGFGVMVLMDSISGQALSVREIKHETNALYAEALNALREKGVVIQSIVCDGGKDCCSCSRRFLRNCASFIRSKLSAAT